MWAQTFSLTPPLFIDVHVTNLGKCTVMYLCVSSIHCVTFFDFGIEFGDFSKICHASSLRYYKLLSLSLTYAWIHVCMCVWHINTQLLYIISTFNYSACNNLTTLKIMINYNLEFPYMWQFDDILREKIQFNAVVHTRKPRNCVIRSYIAWWR